MRPVRVKVGLEPLDELPANPNTSVIPPEQAVRDPVQSSKTDLLAAFVASLTPEQRQQLGQLLAEKLKE